MNSRGKARRSLETVAALMRIPFEEIEQLLEAVKKGVISEIDARESLLTEGVRVQGVY
jgi:hypothetical protein